jgi:site-specific recombinase XerD
MQEQPVLRDRFPAPSRKAVARSGRLPTVLSRPEVERLLNHVQGVPGLVVRLLYGAGMHLAEALRLRIGDLDLEMHQAVVRDGRGVRKRIVPLPDALMAPLRIHLGVRQAQFRYDLQHGIRRVWLPPGLRLRGYDAGCAWEWQYVFVASEIAVDWRDRSFRRRRLDEGAVRACIRHAAGQTGLQRRVSPQVLWHTHAAHLLDCGHDIRAVQALLGHRDVRQTLRFARVLERRAV